MQRGEIWWADLPTPVASEPGYRRPVLIIQSNEFNRSRIRTVIAVVTTNLRLAEAPGNIVVKTAEAGLPQDSVVNVSQSSALIHATWYPFLSQRLQWAWRCLVVRYNR